MDHRFEFRRPVDHNLRQVLARLSLVSSGLFLGAGSLGAVVAEAHISIGLLLTGALLLTTAMCVAAWNTLFAPEPKQDHVIVCGPMGVVVNGIPLPPPVKVESDGRFLHLGKRRLALHPHQAVDVAQLQEAIRRSHQSAAKRARGSVPSQLQQVRRDRP